MRISSTQPTYPGIEMYLLVLFESILLIIKEENERQQYFFDFWQRAQDRPSFW